MTWPVNQGLRTGSKTPGHLRYVREIERHIPGSKIIHMIRSGPAVIASLHEAHRLRPDIWGPSPTTSRLVGAWRSDLRPIAGLRRAPQPPFRLLRASGYEPVGVLRRLCSLIELPAGAATLDQMMSDYPAAGRRSTGSVRNPMPVERGRRTTPRSGTTTPASSERSSPRSSKPRSSARSRARTRPWTPSRSYRTPRSKSPSITGRRDRGGRGPPPPRVPGRPPSQRDHGVGEMDRRAPRGQRLQDTGVPRDEGMFLQDVYPPSFKHGGPGRFALDPDAHLTESSPLVSAESSRRLWAAWSRFWDLDKPVLLEKSPPNLIRTRFLQALFPEARFIIVVRHPIAVAYATKVWSRTSLRSLLRHWIRAHEHFLADAPSLDHVALVRYEDLVADPVRELAKLHGFLGLEPSDGPREVRSGLNAEYYRRWSQQGRRRAAGPAPILRKASLHRLPGALVRALRAAVWVQLPCALGFVASPRPCPATSWVAHPAGAGHARKRPPPRLVTSHGDV